MIENKIGENIRCNDNKGIDAFDLVTPKNKEPCDELQESIENTASEVKQLEHNEFNKIENVDIQNEALVGSVIQSTNKMEQAENSDLIEIKNETKIQELSSVGDSTLSTQKVENLFENSNEIENENDDLLDRVQKTLNEEEAFYEDNLLSENQENKSEDRKDSESETEREHASQDRSKNKSTMEEHSCEDHIHSDDQEDKSEEEEGKDREDSESEAENKQLVNDEEEDMLLVKPAQRKERRSKTISKQLRKETKSEQQRLMREKSVQIPYHTPTCKPLKEFLQRVPQLEKKSKSILADKNSKRFSLDGIFKSRPSLSQPDVVEINLDEDDDAYGKEGKSENSGLTLFMKRFKKHNDVGKKIATQDKNHSPLLYGSKTCPPKLPGTSRITFKEELKRNIIKKRQEYHYDLEKQLNFFDEDNYGDEAEEDEEEEEEDKSFSEEENKDDLEVKEEQGKEDGEEVEEMKNSHSSLNSPHKSDEEGELSENVQNEEDVTYQEDSCSSMSSFLHPGQGEPSNFKRRDEEVQLTPFTKLLKSGLLDSKDDNEEASSLLLPNENTQDLFQHNECNGDKQFEDDGDDDDECQSFSLRLDEDAQFGNVDLQEDSNTKGKSVKSLFDDDMKLDSTMSMTQVLGFCSGLFNERTLTEDVTVEGKNVSSCDVEIDGNDRHMINESHEEYDGDVDDGDENNEDMDNGNEDDGDDEDVDDGDVDDGDGDGGDESEEHEKNDWTERRRTGNKTDLSGDECSDTEKIKERPAWKKNLFYEEEAELSGSDVGSDDEDLGSEYDEYEVDFNVDQKYKSTEKLKKQVHKIHQRKMLDQDKKEIRLLQELYLEDGDLGGGLKRKRNFHWRNVDRDDDYVHNENNLSDGEEIEHEIDIQKKLERLDRDNFIQEVQDSAPLTLDECSQSVLDKISSEKDMEGNVTPRYCSYKLPQAKKPKRSGSFLGVSKPAVKVLVNTTNTSNSKNTKNFVFQAQEKTSVRRSNSSEVDASSNSFMEPPRKVTKLDKSKSIFYLM